MSCRSRGKRRTPRPIHTDTFDVLDVLIVLEADGKAAAAALNQTLRAQAVDSGKRSVSRFPDWSI
ncbi:MAG: hypothetical protein ACKESB_03455 [Candidatus Hodgkinia cicadicola]